MTLDHYEVYFGFCWSANYYNSATKAYKGNIKLEVTQNGQAPHKPKLCFKERSVIQLYRKMYSQSSWTKSNCAYKNKFLARIEIALWYAVDYQL